MNKDLRPDIVNEMYSRGGNSKITIPLHEYMALVATATSSKEEKNAVLSNFERAKKSLHAFLNQIYKEHIDWKVIKEFNDSQDACRIVEDNGQIMIKLLNNEESN